MALISSFGYKTVGIGEEYVCMCCNGSTSLPLDLGTKSWNLTVNKNSQFDASRHGKKGLKSSRDENEGAYRVWRGGTKT